VRALDEGVRLAARPWGCSKAVKPFGARPPAVASAFSRLLAPPLRRRVVSEVPYESLHVGASH